jgi:hypothetical protein
MKKALIESGATKFLCDRPYHWDASFSRHCSMVYSTSMIFAKLEFLGQNVGRIKSIITDYIESLGKKINS